MTTAHSTTPWPDELTDDRWQSAVAEKRGGTAYGVLMQSQRLLQDRIAGAVLPPEILASVTAQLTEVAELLAGYQAAEAERWDGWRPDLPGRAHPLLPPYVIDEQGDRRLRGRVVFTRFYLGGNGAAHGGSHTLLFDDVMGNIANQQGGVSRTARLTVNYRRITPLDVGLQFDVALDRVDGRKRWVTARLVNAAGEVVADAEGLFLQLRTGQA